MYKGTNSKNKHSVRVVVNGGATHHEKSKKLETKMLLMIFSNSSTKALMLLVGQPIAVLKIVVTHFLVTLFEVVLSIVIPIIRTLVFTNFVLAL